MGEGGQKTRKIATTKTLTRDDIVIARANGTRIRRTRELTLDLIRYTEHLIRKDGKLREQIYRCCFSADALAR